MRYVFYKLLQNYVHNGHKKQKAILLEEYKRVKPNAVLEIACGGGNLADIFSPAEYIGIDLNAERVNAAKKAHPEYKFIIADVNDPGFKAKIKDFDFIFCHGLLHHLDNVQSGRLLEIVLKFAKKPTTFILIEPILPSIWINPLGYMFAKFDDGKHMRLPEENRALAGKALIQAKRLSFWPRWPQQMEAYILEYN